METKIIEKTNLFTQNQKEKVASRIICGDCFDVLKEIDSDSVDLVVTSPPYADQREKTYGGIKPNEYVEWFLPISAQLFRVLKPTGTFILNIKEKVTGGERHAYVLELILSIRKQGWLWTEEFIWHKKKIVTPVNGLTDSETLGNGFSNLINSPSSICIKNL